MPTPFNQPANERLKAYLRERGGTERVEPLTPDASTREYFRVRWRGATAVACVYPEPFGPDLTYLDVTDLFRKAGLPVAEVYDTAFERGIVIHEDFGDRILRDVLAEAPPERLEELLDEALGLIARIQQATPLAFELGSVASRLKFDVEKLSWELDFFREHYFESLRKKPLDADTRTGLETEFGELSRELETRAAVLTHRDFHAANLLVGADGRLRIIDHQDARIGPVTYDPVSLLLDRIESPPEPGRIGEKLVIFQQERQRLGLEPLDPEELQREFDLMTVQRCLKAIGTFSNQAANLGRDRYARYIDPMFRVVHGAALRLQRFPVLRTIIKTEINEQ